MRTQTKRAGRPRAQSPNPRVRELQALQREAERQMKAQGHYPAFWRTDPFHVLRATSQCLMCGYRVVVDATWTDAPIRGNAISLECGQEREVYDA